MNREFHEAGAGFSVLIAGGILTHTLRGQRLGGRRHLGVGDTAWGELTGA